MTSPYDDDFYTLLSTGVQRSSQKYVQALYRIYQPKSIIDIGCGRGIWLQSFGKCGATKLVGLDGKWNNKKDMVSEHIEFQQVDLNNIPLQSEKYDLAVSLEVAEHLHPDSAAEFVSSICELSDAVLFSAAYTWQGGVDHQNEQPHSYWAELFQKHNFIPYDLFRPAFWGEEDVEFWYRQNAFMYLRQHSSVESIFAQKGCQPMVNLAFMDCIHPDLYAAKLREIVSAHQALQQVRIELQRIQNVLPLRIYNKIRRIVLGN